MSSRRLVQLVSRRFSTTTLKAKDEIHPGYPKLWAAQEHFQKPDGKPVHLKGGAFDGTLYRLTFGLCIVALVFDFKLYYDLAFPKK